MGMLAGVALVLVDARPHHLLRICDKIAGLKYTTPDDIVLGKVAAVITDEMNAIANWRLPRRITDGHAVYLSSTMFHRCRLPGGELHGRLLPIVVAPDHFKFNMVLPLSCWPPGLIDAWPRLDEMASHAPRLAAHRVTDEQAEVAIDAKDGVARQVVGAGREDAVVGLHDARPDDTAGFGQPGITALVALIEPFLAERPLEVALASAQP